MDIFQTFRKKAETTPKEIMIYEEGRQISYLEAYQMVNYWSLEIEKKLSGDEKRVLLKLNHSYRIIIAILSVMKLGASFVPIPSDADPKYIRKIMSYCETDVIISDSYHADFSRQIIMTEELPLDTMTLASKASRHYSYGPQDEVYVLFTSGSTGEPKGCAVLYHNLQYIITNMIHISHCKKNSIYLFSTPYTFDVSITEIFSFLYGAKIFVNDIKNYDDYQKIPSHITKHHITHLAFSPSAFKNMLRTFNAQDWQRMSQSLECVMLAGEVFHKEIFEEWAKSEWDFRLLNLYGPTEGTVYALGHELFKTDNYEGSIPIGLPLEGCHYQIDQPNEAGIGELVLIGEGVVKGYINNTQEEKKRFKKLPDGENSYRTGDLVSVKNNIVYYHGRSDDQVQINGIRIELGEIEYRIKQIPSVEEAVVLYEDQRLILFVQLSYEDYLEEKLKAHLPRHMLPNIQKRVDEFPLNRNNKIDRKKLLEIYKLEKQGKEDLGNLHAVSLEEKILKLMNVCLQGKGTLSAVSDDFYEFGADSLDTFLLISQLEQELKCKLPIDLIYQLRTPREIALRISRDESVEGEREVRAATQNEKAYKNLPTLTAQVKTYLYPFTVNSTNTYQALYLQGYYYYKRLKSTVTFTYELDEGYDEKEIQTVLAELIANHPILYTELEEIDGLIYFKEKPIPADFSVPVFDAGVSDIPWTSILLDNYSEELYYCRYHQGLLALFILVKQYNRYTILGLLDHTIADGASISLLKNKLGELLKGKKQEKVPAYQNYCWKIYLANRDIDEALQHWYLKYLKKCHIQNKDRLLTLKTGSSYLTVEISKLSFQNNLDLTKYISFLVGQKLSPVLQQDHLSLRTMVNLREYSNFPYQNSLGDLHCSISMFYKAGESYAHFSDRAERVYALFAEDFFRHSSYLMNRSGVDLQKKKQLQAITEAADIVSINYGGTLTEKELKSYQVDVPKMQARLNKIHPRLYVTAFMTSQTLHIFMNKELNKVNGG